MLPSLVTWPTITVAMFWVLATRTRAAATSLTWVTPPGTPSTSAAPMVCTESMTSSCGTDLLDVAEHRAEVGLRGEVELVVDRAGPVGPQPHLGRGLLAGDVEHPQPGARRLGRDLQQQRGLADAGLAGEQHRRPGDHAAAEHPVELGDAAGARAGVLDRHLADRDGGAAHRAGGGAALRLRRPPPRRCPRPGTRRSGRPTSRSPSRTPRSGTSHGPVAALLWSWHGR